MGNTTITTTKLVLSEDHPHIHGEYQIGRRFFHIQKGSPPHTWGILEAYQTNRPIDRITPTYMGNTIIQRQDGTEYEDHPHIHGEYARSLSITIGCSGSPPHTWGILWPLIYVSQSARITPTYMGNTTTAATTIAPVKDHPHIHGEYSINQLC